MKPSNKLSTKIKIWLVNSTQIKNSNSFSTITNSSSSEYKLQIEASLNPNIEFSYYNLKYFSRAYKDENGKFLIVTIDGNVIHAPDIIINGGIPTRTHSIIKNLELILTETLFINPADSVLLCNDKNLTVSFLENYGLRQPKTYLVNSSTDLRKISNDLGFPLILKSLNGTHGDGVLKINNLEDLYDIATFSLLTDKKDIGNHPLLLQEFISTSYGRDVRAIVIGDKYIGGMIRFRNDGYFKSNYNAKIGNSSIESYALSKKVQDSCIAIIRDLGLDFAGIDLLFTQKDDEFVIGEINAAPGFRAFEQANKNINLSKELLDFALKKYSGN